MLEEKNIISDHYTQKFLLYFAATCVGITFAYIFSITFITIPKENQRYADVCLGFLLGTLISTIITFYFGSSSSSKEKDAAYQKLINDSLSQLNPPKDVVSTSQTVTNSTSSSPITIVTESEEK